MKKGYLILALFASVSMLVAGTILIPQTSVVKAAESSEIVVLSGYEYDLSTLPPTVTVGQTGQIKRPSDNYLAKAEHSFTLKSSDESVLSFDEKGQWKAHKVGIVQVTIDLANTDAFKAELSALGLTKQIAIKENDNTGFVTTVEVTEAAKDIDIHKIGSYMNRVYNPNSGEHFYTSAVAEKNHLISLGWKDEGQAWIAPDNGDVVYRLYNPNAGDHHYTTSAGERDALVNVGWKSEGEGWKSGGTVPIYRLYNPNAKKAGAHHYTTSTGERDFLVNLGWKNEGIGWYGMNK
ncbi:hypothetical protein [Streptococcus merionis]|uniref:hypothetical protein n=1 Tax=Streptococcus merionis TaxID=400065 RepID=UPI0026EB5D67|nr:hypothetical protein [Streptococcus merionis]